MFVRYYTYLDQSFSDLASVFTARDLPLNDWAADAYRDGERLSVKIGLGGTETPKVAKTVELELENLYSGSDRDVLSVRWTATGPSALFPRMDADLILEPVGPGLTQLTLQGSYVPPLGVTGALLDRWVLHRVAEASVKNLVDRVAAALSGHAHAQA